jgi:hypothetical protein
MSTHRLTLATLVWLCALAGGLLLSASALAVREHSLAGSFGETCPAEPEPCGNGQFREAIGIAVNETSGNIYVVDRSADRVQYFNAKGKYLGQFDGSGSQPSEEGKPPSGPFEAPDSIAIDNSKSPSDPSAGDVYVEDSGHHVVDKYTSAGAYVGQVTTTESALPLGTLHGIAVDPAGRLWISEERPGFEDFGADDYTNAVTNQFIAYRKTVGGFGFQERGLAVDSSGSLYMHINGLFPGTDVVTKFAENGDKLIEALEAEPPTGIATESSTDDVYVAIANAVERFEADGTPIERATAAGLEAAAVAVSSATEVMYVADKATEKIDVFTPEPPSKPAVSEPSAAEVTSDSATLRSHLSPHGASTEYFFELGACQPAGCVEGEFESVAPSGVKTLSADFGDHLVLGRVQNLAAQTTYHYRVVARNANGSTTGEEGTFKTLPVGSGVALAGDRRWELVSPPNKHGSEIEPIRAPGVIQAASSGNAITYVANAPTGADPQGNSNGVQVLARRGPAGWESQDISLPDDEATGLSVGTGREYKQFSPDLSQAIVQPIGGFRPLTPKASEQTAYLRTNSAEPCTSACYTPLVTGAEGFSNVPAGTEFGEDTACPIPKTVCGPHFVDGTADLEHLVLESSAALTSESPGVNFGLYEWTAGRLSFIGAGAIGNGGVSMRNAISQDGTKVFFGGGAHGRTGLYVHDEGTGETLQLDVPQGGSGEGPAAPKFQIASRNGSRVIFSDEQRLTSDSGASEEKPDLYQCDLAVVGERLSCALTDLTPIVGGQPGEFMGGVLGANSDASTLYFVANGALAPGTVTGHCPATVSSKNAAGFSATCTLYVEHNGVVHMIAELSGEDFPDWAAALKTQTAKVTSDGQWLAFMSDRPLTGYDNRDVISGHRDQEVFTYEAASDMLRCVSCNPTGARPAGVERGSEETLAFGVAAWQSDQWLAATVPSWITIEVDAVLRQPEYLSTNGRVYFNSSDRLTPSDSNHTQDVYEYSPSQVGCTAHAGVPAADGGCIALVSAGTSSQEAAFLDASESGSDVFFLTAAHLVTQDTDSSYDVYDTHTCSSEMPCVAPSKSGTPCASSASCRGEVTSPAIDLGSGPATTAPLGKGNLAPMTSAAPTTRSLSRSQRLKRALASCKKLAKRSRAVCRKRAQARYGPKQSLHRPAKKRKATQ